MDAAAGKMLEAAIRTLNAVADIVTQRAAEASRIDQDERNMQTRLPDTSQGPLSRSRLITIYLLNASVRYR